MPGGVQKEGFTGSIIEFVENIDTRLLYVKEFERYGDSSRKWSGGKRLAVI